MTTTTNAMGSGCEVESATFRIPESDLSPIEPVMPVRSGFRGRLDDLKARGLGRVHEMQRSLGDRRVAQMDRVQTSMKTSPMLWAGIAAGSGFAVGMIGRLIHWRNSRRHRMPELVIIDASC